MKHLLRLTILALVVALTGLVVSATAEAAGRPNKLTLWGVDRMGDAITGNKNLDATFTEKLVDAGDAALRVGKVKYHVKRADSKSNRYLKFTGVYRLHGGKIKVEGKMIRYYYLHTWKATLDIVRGKGRYHGITGHLRFLPKHGETKHTFTYRPPE